MADKKDTKKGDDNPFGDLKWAGAILLGIFIVWLFTGGPERYINQKGPFIKAPEPLDSGEIYGTKKDETEKEYSAPTKWKAVNTKYITFSLPPLYSFIEDETAPYYKGRITNGVTTLFIEYGFSVLPIAQFGNPNFYTNYEKINGDNAKILWPKNKKVNKTGVFFDNLIGKKLSVYGVDLSRSEQAMAFAFFRTLDIK